MESLGRKDYLASCQRMLISSSHIEDIDSPFVLVDEEGDSETSHDSLEKDYDPTPGYHIEGLVNRPPRRSPNSTTSKSRTTTHLFYDT